VEVLAGTTIEVPVPSSRPGMYLKRALRACVGQGLIRRIGEDRHRVSFALVRELMDVGSASWQGDLEEAVVLDKKTGEIEFKYDFPLADKIVKAMEGGCGGLTAAEIGTLTGRIILERCCGVSMRDPGGLYLVPPIWLSRLGQLEGMLKLLSDDIIRSFHTIRVTSDEARSGSLHNIVEEVLVREGEAILNGCVRAASVKETRPSVFLNRLRKLQRVQNRVDAFSIFFRLPFPNVDSVINQAKQIAVAQAAERGRGS